MQSKQLQKPFCERSVAIINDRLDIEGGAGNVALGLASILAKKKFAVTVFTTCFDASLWPEELCSGFSLHLVPDSIGPFRLEKSKRVRRLLVGRYLSGKLDKFDIVICSNSIAMQWLHLAKKYNKNVPLGIFLCQEPTRKVFGEITDTHFFSVERQDTRNGYNTHILHDIQKQRSQWRKKRRKYARDAMWEVEAASSASVLVANSMFSARHIETVFQRSPLVVYPGIFKNGEVTKCTQDEAEPYIGYVGRLSTKKNVQNILESFRIFRELTGNSQLLLKFIGDGPAYTELRARTSSLGLEKKVFFRNYLNDRDLSVFYANAEMIIYIPIDEPFGLVPLEALAHGTPVIVSDHGGPAEVLSHKLNAYLVNPFDPEKVAEAISYFLANRNVARSMAIRGRDLVASYYTMDRFADEVLRLIETSGIAK